MSCGCNGSGARSSPGVPPSSHPTSPGVTIGPVNIARDYAPGAPRAATTNSAGHAIDLDDTDLGVDTVNGPALAEPVDTSTTTLDDGGDSGSIDFGTDGGSTVSAHNSPLGQACQAMAAQLAPTKGS